MPILRLLNDEPIGEGSSISNDGLGFKVYSKILGDVIINTPTPFTIGIFGEWGTGKTSLMRMIEKQIINIDKDNVITIWFNAWQFGDESHPIIPLAIHIANRLKKEKSFTKSLGDAGNTLLDVLDSLVAGISLKGKINAGVAEVEAGIDAGKSLDRQDKLINSRLIGTSLYYDIFNTLSNLGINKNKRIVVFIDDMDRCLPNTAIKLLEAIKLVLAQSGFTFVLGVSRSVIEGYLTHRYEVEYGLKGYDGKSYFDKIVQLPFYIPSHSSRMDYFSNQILNRLEKENRQVLKPLTKIIGAACKNNPRAVIRFINNIIIDQEINKALFESREMNRVISIEYFAITRALQQNWNEIYVYLSNSPELSKTVSSWDNNEKIRDFKLLLGSNTKEEKFADNVLNDKELHSLLITDAGKKWLLNEQERREATEFLFTQRAETLSLDEALVIKCSACGRQFNFELVTGKYSADQKIQVQCPFCLLQNIISLEELLPKQAVLYK